MMENFTAEKKPPEITERQKRLMAYRMNCSRYGNWTLRDLIEFCAEWQEATGKLFFADARTKEKGREKLEDAQERRKDLKQFENEGRLKR